MTDLPPNTVLVNSQQEEKLVVDPHTGALVPIGAKNTVIYVDANGGRHVRIKDVVFRGEDERLINPAEPLFACCCGCGQSTLSKHSIVFCVACQRPVALGHAAQVDGQPVCPEHYPKGIIVTLTRLALWIKDAIR